MPSRPRLEVLLKFVPPVLLLCSAALAENMIKPEPPLPNAPSAHRFWTIEQKISIGAFAGLVAADAITTQRGLSQGLREGDPIARPFVNMGAPGQALGSALGFGAGVGTVYFLHRTHHHKAERITMRLLLAGEGAMVGNNIYRIR